MQELLKKVRPVTDVDEKLPVFSYSRFEVYSKCPMRYKLQYVENKRSEDTTLALELGSLLHYILEQKGKMLLSGGVVDYELLNNLLQNGVMETDDKTWQPLRGVLELKRKYDDEWYKPDNKSGMNYEEKLVRFDKVLHSEMENTDWSPALFEHKFRFVWDDKIIIEGYIDRIDRKGDKYRTIDYKTSKAPFSDEEADYSLQFGIYALAMLNEFGTLPEQSVYRFVLIDKNQAALKKDWKRRITAMLDGLISSIAADTEKGVFEPKPIALCYWCNYCRQNPNATTYKNECDYFCKWTPDNRTTETNMPWNG